MHATGQSRRILIVEDDASARSALATLLRDEGYEVQLARDGIDAFAKLATFPAEVVVTDIEMPRMDGLALREAVRELPMAMPRFIFMSGHRRPEDDSAFMLKPIEFDALHALLAQDDYRVSATAGK